MFSGHKTSSVFLYNVGIKNIVFKKSKMKQKYEDYQHIVDPRNNSNGGFSK